jgi:hypothetical protein
VYTEQGRNITQYRPPKTVRQQTVHPQRRGQAVQDGLSRTFRPSHTSKNTSKNIARGSCLKPWGASVAGPRLWRSLKLLPKPEAALSGASCGGHVGPDGNLFSHPFVGALIKTGIRLWVINHNSRFVMHRLIPHSLYQSGAKYTMQDGTTATWQSCAGGCVRGGVPKAHLQKHIKKTSKSGGAFRGLGARLAQKKHPERPQNWDCLRCLQDGPANERCIQGDVAELHRMVCPPRFAQAEPQKHSKNITKNSPWRSFLKLRGASPAGPCF